MEINVRRNYFAFENIFSYKLKKWLWAKYIRINVGINIYERLGHIYSGLLQK